MNDNENPRGRFGVTTGLTGLTTVRNMVMRNVKGLEEMPASPSADVMTQRRYRIAELQIKAQAANRMIERIEQGGALELLLRLDCNMELKHAFAERPSEQLLSPYLAQWKVEPALAEALAKAWDSNRSLEVLSSNQITPSGRGR